MLNFVFLTVVEELVLVRSGRSQRLSV